LQRNILTNERMVFSIDTVSDLDITNPNSVMINSQQLFGILLSIIGQDNSFDENGYPILKEEHEKLFIKKIQTIPFNLILHNSLLSSNSKLPFIIDKFYNSLFMYLSYSIRKPEPLTYKQRFIYLEDLKHKGLLPTLKNVILHCFQYQRSKNIKHTNYSQPLTEYFNDCKKYIEEKEELEIIVKALEKNNEDFKITRDDVFKLNQIYAIYQAIVENSYETPNDKMNKADFYLKTFEDINKNLNFLEIFKGQQIDLMALKKKIFDFIQNKRNDPVNILPQILAYLNHSFDQIIEQYLKEKFNNENYVLIMNQYFQSKKELLDICNFLDEEFQNVQFKKKYKIRLQDELTSVFEKLRDKEFDQNKFKTILINYYNLLNNINESSKKEENLKDEEFLNDLKLMIGNCKNNLQFIIKEFNNLQKEKLPPYSSLKKTISNLEDLNKIMIQLNENSLQEEINEAINKINQLNQVQNDNGNQQYENDDQQNEQESDND